MDKAVSQRTPSRVLPLTTKPVKKFSPCKSVHNSSKYSVRHILSVFITIFTRNKAIKSTFKDGKLFLSSFLGKQYSKGK